MSTPPYAPPSIGPAGLVVPSYPSILADNIQGYLNIFGPNQYVGPDSAIYQLLSILSLKQSDCNAALQLAYNQSSPQTAVGAGLDRAVKMNGLARAPFTYSTALLTVTGAPGTNISDGFAQDTNGNLWALPSGVTIPGGGNVNVIGTCTTPGNVAANPGSISIISTPVNGWTSVTNAAAAIAGDPVETDSQLRARQSISVALPGVTPTSSTIAAILAIVGVTRVAPGYPTSGGPGTSIENPTGVTDSWGNPAHSISMVVEGGSSAAIALSIYEKKTIGCFTNGTTSVVVTDPTTGFNETISFYRPTYVPIFVLIAVHGYSGTPTATTLAAIQAAIVAYLNELQIGETVSIAAISYEAMALNAALSQPSFGVQSLQIGVRTAVTTATTVMGTNTITVASATGIVNGQLIVGAGIPAGTTVSGAPSGLTVTMSANATASASGVGVAFSTLGTVDVPMPNYYDVAQGVTADVAVVTV